MNTEVIKEIANQLGIAVSAVTKDVIPRIRFICNCDTC
jgi:hypothetical protein